MKRQWLELGPILPLTEAELRQHGESSDVYVDAIFGTGLARAPDDQTAAILRHLGGANGDGHFYRPRLVAVDCPSGLCLDSGRFLGDPIFTPSAALTVAFDSPKIGHLLADGPVDCGDLVIADIGLREWREFADTGRTYRQARLIGIAPEFAIADSRPAGVTGEPVPLAHLGKGAGARREAKEHKFDHGHALIIAGGSANGGAARLSARAALRVGAGLVTICPPRDALAEHTGTPDALMRRAIDDAGALTDLLTDHRINALCLGPGCGTDRAADLLPQVLAARRATVLDADALTALASLGFDGLHDRCVLTPHLGEFARLFPDLARKLAGPAAHGPAYSKLDAARDAAARCGAVVLLKGPDTVIAAPDGQARIHSAFDVPWLATAGSGDVLAGIITGLLARGIPALDAASLGALIHARAARRFGPGLIADDLPDEIPGVFRDMKL